MVRRRTGSLLAVLFLVTASMPWPGASRAASPATASVEAPPASGLVGCLARRGGEVVASQLPDARFVPASVHKLAVSTAALHFLGPDYRVTTRLESTAALEDGVLRGDLVVLAAGDATWGSRFFDGGAAEPLAVLARRLVAAGVRRVEGDLVLDLSRFPGRPSPPTRSLGDLAFGFGAPTSALAVEENKVILEMAPGGRVGERPELRSGDLEILNLATTAPAVRHERGTVDFQAEWSSGRLVVRGEYPISEPPYRIEIAVADGDPRAGRALRRELERAGVAIAGELEVSAERRPGRLLAELASPPLGAWLEPILTDSSNWHAEMLLRVLAAEVLGEGRLGDGLEVVEKFLVGTVGVGEGAVVLDDASGISPYDLWTPRAVVDLLEWSWRQPWRGVLLGALARPGKGTLKAWPGLPAGLLAKTGTQRNALALAGYLLPGKIRGATPRDAAAPPLVFACFHNHSLEPRPALRRDLASRLLRWSRN